MSWLSRLFGSTPPPPPPPPPNLILIPEDVVAPLTQDGTALAPAVEKILRSHLEQLARPAPLAEKMPFWLEREEAGSELEDELRDRVTQRRAAEDHA